MAIYGYVRKDYPLALEAQLEYLAPYHCDKVFVEEKVFQPSPNLDKLVALLNDQDEIIVVSLAVFGKNIKMLGRLLAEFQQLNVHLVSLIEEIDTLKMPMFYHLTSGLITSITQCHSQQLKQSIALSTSEGMANGRPPIQPETIAHIRYLYENKKKSLREIASECQVSLGTVHKYCQKEGGVFKNNSK